MLCLLKPNMLKEDLLLRQFVLLTPAKKENKQIS